MVAQGGMVPLGYYKDPEKSAKTFKEIDGKRYAFIGDMARLMLTAPSICWAEAPTALIPAAKRSSRRG